MKTAVLTSATNDINGKLESSSVTISRQPNRPITVIKKGQSLSPRSSRTETVDEYQTIKSPRKAIIEENDELEVKKASFFISNSNDTPKETTQTKVIYAQSSSKTLGQIIQNEYEIPTNNSKNNNIVNILTPNETVSSNEYNDFEESNGNYSNDSNNYGISNLVNVIDNLSQGMPSKSLIPNY